MCAYNLPDPFKASTDITIIYWLTAVATITFNKENVWLLYEGSY